MNRVICLKECPIDHLEWHSSDEEDDDDNDDDDDDDDEEDDNQGMETAEPEGVEISHMEEEEDGLCNLEGLRVSDEDLSDEAKAELEKKLALRRQATTFMGVSKDTTRSEADILSTPEPGEILKTFYERSKHYWAAQAHEIAQGQSRGKQLRRDGFDVCKMQQ